MLVTDSNEARKRKTLLREIKKLDAAKWLNVPLCVVETVNHFKTNIVQNSGTQIEQIRCLL